MGEGGCLPGGTSRGTKGSFERVAAGGSLPPMALLSTTGMCSLWSPWVLLGGSEAVPVRGAHSHAASLGWAAGRPPRRSLEETFPQAVVLRQVAWEGGVLLWSFLLLRLMHFLPLRPPSPSPTLSGAAPSTWFVLDK